MVLRDARVYTLVDDCSSQRLCPGAVPYHLAVPAVLQRTRRILSKPGTRSSCYVHKHTSTNMVTVLAPSNDILLLRSPLARPPLPHLLPPAILAPPRRELRALACPLLMAPHLRVHAAAMHCAHVQHGLSR